MSQLSLYNKSLCHTIGEAIIHSNYSIWNSVDTKCCIWRCLKPVAHTHTHKACLLTKHLGRLSNGRHIVERLNKAEVKMEEHSEKAESCWENLWNEIQSKGTWGTERDAKSRIKGIGQARFVMSTGINRPIPTTWRWAREDVALTSCLPRFKRYSCITRLTKQSRIYFGPDASYVKVRHPARGLFVKLTKGELTV